MALKKPVVIGASVPLETIQSGDTLQVPALNVMAGGKIYFDANTNLGATGADSGGEATLSLKSKQTFSSHTSEVRLTSDASAATFAIQVSVGYTLYGTGAGVLQWGGQNVWTAGNDGAGSGLDADLMDGQQGTHYLDRNNHTGKQALSSLSQSGAADGQLATWDSASGEWVAKPSAPPGSNGSIVFNNNGAWGGDTGLTWISGALGFGNNARIFAYSGSAFTYSYLHVASPDAEKVATFRIEAANASSPCTATTTLGYENDDLMCRWEMATIGAYAGLIGETTQLCTDANAGLYVSSHTGFEDDEMYYPYVIKAGNSLIKIYNHQITIQAAITGFNSTPTRFLEKGMETGDLRLTRVSSVTQATSKSTAVTVSERKFNITMHSAALAANTTVSFLLNCSTINADSVVLLNHKAVGSIGSYNLHAEYVTSGQARVYVRNVTAASLSQAIVINGVVL